MTPSRSVVAPLLARRQTATRPIPRIALTTGRENRIISVGNEPARHAMDINPRRAVGLSFALLVLVQAAALGQTPAPAEAARLEFFEKRIRPLLVSNCYNCHSANTNSK